MRKSRKGVRRENRTDGDPQQAFHCMASHSESYGQGRKAPNTLSAQLVAAFPRVPRPQFHSACGLPSVRSTQPQTSTWSIGFTLVLRRATGLSGLRLRRLTDDQSAGVFHWQRSSRYRRHRCHPRQLTIRTNSVEQQIEPDFELSGGGQLGQFLMTSSARSSSLAADSPRDASRAAKPTVKVWITP